MMTQAKSAVSHRRHEGTAHGQGDDSFSKEIGWLGRQDSNLGMPVPKTGALPLGDAPTATHVTERSAG
jgi:hypothetical protein